MLQQLSSYGYVRNFNDSFVRKFWMKEIGLIQKRQEARVNRDFATADQIRDQLAAQG